MFENIKNARRSANALSAGKWKIRTKKNSSLPPSEAKGRELFSFLFLILILLDK